MDTTGIQSLISRISQELGQRLLTSAPLETAWGRLCDAELAEILRQVGLQTLQYMIDTAVADEVARHQSAGLTIKHTPTIRYNTIFGPLDLESPYVWKHGGLSAKPLRDVVGITHDGRSEAVERALTDFGSEGSFEQAADRFAEHYHYHLSRTTADRVTKQAGHEALGYVERRLSAEMTEGRDAPCHADTILLGLDGCLIRTGTFLPASSPPSPTFSLGEAALIPPDAAIESPAPTPPRPSSGEPRHKAIHYTEVRLGFARPLDEERAADKVFVGKVAGYPDIVQDLKHAAGLVGLTNESKVVAVADGGNGLREELDRQFADWNFQFVLDKQHLKDHLYETAEALGIEQAHRAAWVTPWIEMVNEGAIHYTMAKLQELFDQTGETRIERLMGYLERFCDAIDYDDFQDNGLPIGSGEIESAHKSIPQHRLKLPGACWHPDSLNPMMALRIVRANGWWDEFWEDRTARLLAA